MKHTYANLFLQLGKYTALTVVIVAGTITTAAIASNKAFKPVEAGPAVAQSAHLEVRSPRLNVCPAKASMNGWIRTSRPGPVTYMIARKNGALNGPFTTNAVQSVNGAMASFSREFDILKPTESQYQVVIIADGQKVASNWASLQANCRLTLQG